MCGIVGYIGKEQAAPILLNGLNKLEYRGYDSAGIAVRNPDSANVTLVKTKGRLKNLVEKTNNGATVNGTCGIGHTRWATHGEPSENNAHPHCSEDMAIVLVHNGIIENYIELKEKLTRKGYTFYSQTDTEIATKLIDYYYKKIGTPIEAISRAMLRIRGSYSFGIMFSDFPGKIYAARKDSPLIIGKNETGMFIASDVPAILDKTRNVYYIENMEIAELSKTELHFYNIDQEEISKTIVTIDWDAEAAEKNGYAHFMLKEIHEQPCAIRDTLNSYTNSNTIDISTTGLPTDLLMNLERIYIVACGSAYHAGIVGKYVIEEMTDIPVEVDIASEFRYRNPKLVTNSLVIVISQSGETADTLAALRLAKERNVPVLGIVNVIGSSIGRESDYTLYTYAGPEISVATTKAYSCQLVALYILSIKLGLLKNKISDMQAEQFIKELESLPDKIQRILEDKERIQWFASKYSNAQDIFFIGRGIDYAISLEGSLKLKEISYIHSEAYAAGELKHGTISLIENNTLVICINTQEYLYEKTLNNMLEVKSRGAYLMGITTYGNYNIEDTTNFTVYIPPVNQLFSTSLAIIPLQLMSYYVSLAKGLDVDKPRNLAKSVTVE